MSELEKAKRALYWSEMTDNMKIEELKKELHRTQQQVKDLCSFIKMLSRHEHSGGHIVQPITINSCEEECGNLFFRVHEFK